MMTRRLKRAEPAKNDSALTPKSPRPENVTSREDNRIVPQEEKRSSSVLVVDDFEPFRRLVVSILLQKPGLHIIGQASDGEEAVQKAEELQPDLVLLDIGLPKLNGMEAARRVRKLARNTKILFLSQESAAVVVQDALCLGAGGYLLKSRAASELLPAIEAVLADKHFVSSGLDHRSALADCAVSDAL